jgi:hypothetical protein
MARWFCLIDGKQLGPIEPAKLKQLADAGTLSPHHKVRREDMEQWNEAGQVNGLFTLAHSKVPSSRPAQGSKLSPPASQSGRLKIPASDISGNTAAPSHGEQPPSSNKPISSSAETEEREGIGGLTKIVLATCVTIALPIVGGFVWFVSSHDSWESINSVAATAQLDKADRLQKYDPVGAYKIYEDVLNETKKHKLKDEQFISRLANAEKSRSAIYPVVQEKKRAEEAERPRQADEQARREAAEQDRLAKEERKKRAAEIEAELTKPRTIGDVSVRVTDVKKTNVRLKSMFGERGISKDARLMVSVELENLSDTKIVRFPGWGYDEIGLALSDSHPVKASLVDNVGNSYQRLESGLTMTYEDASSGGDMRPHEKTVTTLIFEQPTDKIEYLELELPARWHNNVSMKWTIPKNKIVTGPAEIATTAKDAEDEVASASPIWVEASDLQSEYDANEVAADQKYKGKILAVTGTVDSIGKDIVDTPYVTLKTAKLIATVQCMFTERDADDLATIQKGDKVVVKGKCDGKLVNVILRGCIMAKIR